MQDMQTSQATSLDNVYKTLSPQPLQTQEELNVLYEERINQVRGGDKTSRLKLGLIRAYDTTVPYKACVMGHQGVGKSTELNRLVRELEDKFRVIRFSAIESLDPGNFQPLDVLLLMMAEVVEQTAKPKKEGGAGKRPSESRLREIKHWYASVSVTEANARESAIGIEGGVGVKDDSLWGQVLGVFASLKGDIKFASARKTEVVEKRLTRLNELLDIANLLMTECNELLRKETGREWLFIGEDFDKAGIPTERIEDLFITYANVFSSLQAHLIFNIPISLYYSSEATRLPFSSDRSLVIPDTPVYTQQHEANTNGQAAVRRALEKRVDPNLFANGQIDRLVVASGGNLRDLFALVNYAADTAILREAQLIEETDTTEAILNLRSDYERRLGESPNDKYEVSYDDKAERLLKIYSNNPTAQMMDKVMYSLLRSRAIQEFNGQRWFGVHPLVVDILKKQEAWGDGQTSQEKKGGSI